MFSGQHYRHAVRGDVDTDSQLSETEGALYSLCGGLQVLQAGQGPCFLAQGMWIQSDNCSF
jgi:hypothetical protein